MRKVIVSVEVTLDAVQETTPDLLSDYWDDVYEKHSHDLLFGADALLTGRITYEGLSEAWLGMAGQHHLADRMNSLPKYVASRTLTEPLTWNATLLKGDVAKAVAELKQQPGQYILQYGIGELTRTLLEHGLVDEIRPLVYPVVVGKGARMFEQVDKTALKLLDSRAFDSGLLALRYQPQSKT